MNENKYPSLEWCEQYGHLFPDSDYALYHGGLRDKKSFIERDPAVVKNCPDALEIMEWLRDEDCYLVPSLKHNTFYTLYIKHLQCPRIESLSWIKALMKAVELVEAK